MGTYLNPGKYAFEEALNSEIFIDKSEMISYLNSVVNTSQRYVSVFRPRRFGKTMAADMISAYYDKEADSRALFEKCMISRTKKEKDTLTWDEYLGKFNVVRLVMTDFFNRKRTVDEAIDTISLRILNELAELYPDTKYDEKDFPYSIDNFLTRKQVKNEGEITQYYVKDSHPGIIPKEEWTAVQQEFDRIDAYMQAHGLTHFGYGSEMRPFSSKVICGKCGRIYGRKAHSAREKTYWQYNTRCYSGVGACDGDNVDEAVIHKVFVEAWNMVIRQQDELNKRWMIQEEEGIELQAFRARQMQELVKQGPITDLIPELVQMVVESIVIKGGYSFDVYLEDTTCINVSFP